MTEYNQLSEVELKTVIEKAEKALKEKQERKHKEVISQIMQLADSIGVSVTITESNEKPDTQSRKVLPKYRDPNDYSKTWSGRGMKPKWMRELIESGRDKSEFLIS